MDLRFIAALLCAAVAWCASAQDKTPPYSPIPGTDQVSVVFPAGRNAISLAMQLLRDVPAIEVQLRGRQGKHLFVIDTGASYTLVDSVIAKQLGLKSSEKGSIAGAGSGRIDVDVVPGVDLEIAGLRSSGHKVVLTDLTGISEILGSKIAGIIGYDLLNKIVVTLDYPSKKVTLRPKGSFTPPSDAQILPLRFKRRWVYVPITVKVAGQAEVTDDFFVDTGSADEVNHPLIKQSSAPTTSTATGVGLGSPTQGVSGTLDYAQLGPFRIERVSSTCCGANPDTYRQVGSGFLKNFVTTFDYASKRLVVSKPK